MKKTKLILTVILTALIASSCGEKAGNNTAAENPLTEKTSEETLPESENGKAAEISEATEKAETSAAAETTVTVTETENSSYETETDVGEKLSELSVAEVGIIGHIEEFDDVVPLKFTLGEETEIDPAVLEIAVNAYRQTDYYTDALEYMREKFIYDDEGNLIDAESGEPADPDNTDFIAGDVLSRHKQLLTESSDRRVDISPVPKWSYKAGDGHLLVLLTVLPDRLLNWSGTGTAYIPVYVNSKGEAFILEEACNQDYDSNGCFTVEYEDGSIHAVMNFGHNMGGMLSAVYSFEEGVPKLELSGYGHIDVEEDMPVLYAYNSFYMNELFFRRENSSQYCLVKGASADEELARAICSDETVLERVPEAWKLYNEGRLNVYGGKYIEITDGFAPTFSVDPQTGKVVKDKSVVDFFHDEFPGDFEKFNIDLT